MWTAAILAGGRARRLGGGDKSALLVGDDSILERQLAVLGSLTPHILIVGSAVATASATEPASVSADEAPFAMASAGATRSGARMVEDRIPGAGALGGLYTALMEAETDQVLVIACDMPFISAPFLTALAALGAGVDAAVPRDAYGRHPLCASYQRRVAAQLKLRIDAGALRIVDALNDFGVRDIGCDELAPFDPDGRLLLNVNTPADYERARRAAHDEPPSV
jgi:molybdopterin-guanine dinucleotide biosynthesis protein A